MYKILANTLFLGKSLHYLPSCHSTNDIAATLLKEGRIKNGGIVITDDQTKGKGQSGNTWESHPHENLTFSIVLKHDSFDVHDQFYLTIIVTIGMVRYMEKLKIPLKIKWPNDIYYGYKKLAGILINNQVKGKFIGESIIGIGLNVNQENFSLPNAISMRLITGKVYPLVGIFEGLVKSIDDEWQRFSQIGKRPMMNSFMKFLLGLNQKLMFERVKTGDKFQGTIRGVDEIGRLLIDSDKGLMEKFDFKEVKWEIGDRV